MLIDVDRLAVEPERLSMLADRAENGRALDELLLAGREPVAAAEISFEPDSSSRARRAAQTLAARSGMSAQREKVLSCLSATNTYVDFAEAIEYAKKFGRRNFSDLSPYSIMRISHVFGWRSTCTPM
jgi:hypothetical protein